MHACIRSNASQSESLPGHKQGLMNVGGDMVHGVEETRGGDGGAVESVPRSACRPCTYMKDGNAVAAHGGFTICLSNTCSAADVSVLDAQELRGRAPTGGRGICGKGPGTLIREGVSIAEASRRSCVYA